MVRTTVEADTENRALEIIAESPDFHRSSTIQLDGQDAPHVNVFHFSNLPIGHHQITCILVGSGDQRVTASRWFTVTSSGSSSR